MPLPKPFITGCDLAGTVEAVGSGVTSFKPGDRVWGSNQGLLGRQGTLAEYAAVHQDWLYPTPPNVTDVQAAAVALTGITAHLGLFNTASLRAGETVFAHGGTGGVGSMIVQMAKAVGARVVTTVGSAAKADLCRQWGTDCVINYKGEDVVARVREFTSVQPAAEYRDYDKPLEQASAEEPFAFFAEVLSHDLPITSFLDSDFVVVNERLARHYGLAGIKGRRTAMCARRRRRRGRAWRG